MGFNEADQDTRRSYSVQPVIYARRFSCPEKRIAINEAISKYVIVEAFGGNLLLREYFRHVSPGNEPIFLEG